jgi:predicted amino acid racemase
VPPELAPDEAQKIVGAAGLELAGLGTNAACARKGMSLGDCLAQFYETTARILWRLGKASLKTRPLSTAGAAGLNRLRPFPLMSVGGSAFLRVFEEPPQAGYGRDAGAAGQMRPAQLGVVTELRCGEALLLGRIPAEDRQDMFVSGAARDAFILEGTVLESYHKNGECQTLLDFGLQDTCGAPLIPREPGVACLFSTSDYLAVSCGAAGPPAIGSRLSFIPTYYALVAAMTSPFVEKVFTGAAEGGADA